MAGLSKVKIIFLLALFLTWTRCTNYENEPSPGSEDWSFVVFGDIQSGYGTYGQLAGIISRIEPVPSGAFCCGDLMLRGTNEAEWISFINCSRPITDIMPFYLARGNHEGNDDAADEILLEHIYYPTGKFYYSFRENGCLFIILNTQERGEDRAILGAQRDWLFNELNTASDDSSVSHIFIFMHQPLFPQGLHKGKNLHNADELHAFFIGQPKIRTVFSGHDHMFYRFTKDGMNYITTGGGGGDLYHGYGGDYHHFTKVSFYSTPFRINIKTIGVFNEVLEDFNL